VILKLYYDSSTAIYYNGWYQAGYPRFPGVYGTLSPTVPFTWATGDLINIYGTYEAL
jgi:hypothetical protein